MAQLEDKIIDLEINDDYLHVENLSNEEEQYYLDIKWNKMMRKLK